MKPDPRFTRTAGDFKAKCIHTLYPCYFQSLSTKPGRLRVWYGLIGRQQIRIGVHGAPGAASCSAGRRCRLAAEAGLTGGGDGQGRLAPVAAWVCCCRCGSAGV